MARADSDEEACPHCGGQGWVVEPDGAAGRARRCGCRSEGMVPRLLEAAAIPPRYRRCTLDNFHVSWASAGAHDELVGARAACRAYVDGFLQPDGRFSEHGLLLVGPPGVGKTHLAVAVLAELVQRYRVRGLFVDFVSLIHEIQSTFDPQSESSKQRVLHPVIDAEVLVLDELGAQKPTAWVNDTLYLILNTRYTRRLTTCFTTNFALPGSAPERRPAAGVAAADYERSVQADPGLERALSATERHRLLEHRIPARLLSRLYEMARVVPIEAGDFRREVVHAAHHN